MLNTKTRIANLDRRITLQQDVVTVEPTGARTVTYTDVQEVWADVKYRTPQLTENLSVSAVADFDVVFVIRYRSDVTPDWRVKYNNATFRITEIAEEGRAGYLFLYSKKDA